MKVCIATGIYPPDVGGPATFAAIAARELPKRGITVAIVTYADRKNRAASAENIFCVSRKLPRIARHIAYFFKVYSVSRDADIILALDPVSAGIPAMWAARFLGVKFLVRIVGDYAWEQGMQRFGVRDLLDDFLARTYGFSVERLRKEQSKVAKLALRVIVPSQYLKSVVARWGVAQDRIVIVPNSLEIVAYQSKNDARLALGFKNFTLLSVGRMVPWKGFSMLVSLMADLRKKWPVSLVILGDGPEKKALEALRDSLKLQNSVFFPGKVPKEVLALYAAGSDAFLLNTAYEGFSHQIIEAMAAGVPVITTFAGGNAEIVRDGVNALAVPYNDRERWHDAITVIIEQPELRMRISEEGKKVKSVYTIEKMMSALIAVFESV